MSFSPLPQFVKPGDSLFLNDGSGRFVDASRFSGLAYDGYSSAAIFFDYDRDGRLDVFLTVVGSYTTERQEAGIAALRTWIPVITTDEVIGFWEAAS